MQCIGLKDKNHKEIYEGDIVLIDGENEYFVVEWEDDNVTFVMNSETLMFDIDEYYVCKIEVIGNIYENAYLLKKSEK